MNIKVPVNLKLQPRRHTDTLIFTSIHLMYLINHFLCRKLTKIIVSEKFFQIWHLFISYRYYNNKQRWWYTGSAFLEFKVPVFKTVLKLRTNSDKTFFRTQVPVLEPQTNPMTFGYALFTFKLCALFIWLCVLFIPLCDYFIRLCALFLWLCALSIICSLYLLFLCALFMRSFYVLFSCAVLMGSFHKR